MEITESKNRDPRIIFSVTLKTESVTRIHKLVFK